jgi:hypothetical protein
MSGLDRTRHNYKRQAEACLAVLAKTKNPASQAMLTAMAHTWLKLAEAKHDNYDGQAARYQRNADEAAQRSRNAGPDLQLMWLRLAESWLGLLHDDQTTCLASILKPEEVSADGRHRH